MQEKLVFSHVSSCLKSHNHHNSLQSACCPGHSTETALLNIGNDLFIFLSKSIMSIPDLLDFSLYFFAIDNCNHVHPLQTDYELADPVLQWFSSYLTDGTEYVLSSNHCSVLAPIYRCAQRVQFFDQCYFPCMIFLCLILLIRSISLTIRLLTTYNHRCQHLLTK